MKMNPLQAATPEYRIGPAPDLQAKAPVTPGHVSIEERTELQGLKPGDQAYDDARKIRNEVLQVAASVIKRDGTKADLDHRPGCVHLHGAVPGWFTGGDWQSSQASFDSDSKELNFLVSRRSSPPTIPVIGFESYNTTHRFVKLESGESVYEIESYDQVRGKLFKADRKEFTVARVVEHPDRSLDFYFADFAPRK